MLDVMRKHSRSFIIYIFFGIIIAVFVVNFGPQSGGCTATTSYAGRIGGTPISQTLFNYALSVSGVRTLQVPEPLMIQRRGMIMDMLIARELLAEEALRLGFRIPQQEIDDMIVEGRFLALGQPMPLIAGEDGKFDYDLFSRYVKYSWGMNVLKFKEQQRRELLAEKLREYMRTTVKAAEDEVLADYQAKNTRVKLAYVRLAPTDHLGQVTLDPEALTAYINANKDKIKAHYEENLTAYQQKPKQLKLELISVKAADEGQAAQAKQQAEAALARIKGGESFAKVARQAATDPALQAAGGLIGWRNADAPALGAEGLNKAVTGLKEGEVSGVIEDKDAYHIVKVAGQRQGDLTLEQAKEEIAWDLYRNEQSLEQAKQQARAFIARAKAGEALEKMFTVEDPAADPDRAKPADETDEAADRSPLKLTITGAFNRSGNNMVPGIGISAELSKAVFALKEGEVAPEPFEVGQMVYLVAAKEREDPDMAQWKKDKQEITEGYIDQKWSSAVLEYAFSRCTDALARKDISVNTQALVTPGYVPSKDDPPLPSYQPCSSLQERPFYGM